MKITGNPYNGPICNPEAEELACELCDKVGGILLWQNEWLRIVRVDDLDYPGFCRVIWKAHRQEMSDLSPAERHYCLDVVLALEESLRVLYRPDKINLASFGNVVPHLHWHVVPRWRNDRHFPEPIWGQPRRDVRPARMLVPAAQLLAELTPRLDALTPPGGTADPS
ncbi:MAG: hypothetical protein RIR00_2282 [Pseudomonadota bacterium]